MRSEYVHRLLITIAVTLFMGVQAAWAQSCSSDGDCTDSDPCTMEFCDSGTCSYPTNSTDSDGDGTPDCSDGCPSNSGQTYSDPTCGCSGTYSTGTCGAGCGYSDTDSDGDGSPDCVDGCPNNAGMTTPDPTCGCTGCPPCMMQGGDSDGDGACDMTDGCPYDPAKTSGGICGCGAPDIDSDGDGPLDCNEGCPNDPNKTIGGQCGCGIADIDSDNDGSFDCNDSCPNDPSKISPGQCGCGSPETDNDSDGAPDCVDDCPTDPSKTNPGQCGCNNSDSDSDSDGTADCTDSCPMDPQKTGPGNCGCGSTDYVCGCSGDPDSDGDGTPDCNDLCPNDSNKTSPGTCGCGNPDTDGDGDGTLDCNDQCPTDPSKTTPGDCGCNGGTAGPCGCSPCDACYMQGGDSDGDGQCNYYDSCPNDSGNDSDSDGVCGDVDNCPNTSNPDQANGDGDSAGDICDACPSHSPQTTDSDSDGDGTLNCNDSCPNDNARTTDSDSDLDGTLDCNDLCPSDPSKSSTNICGCGTPDTDSDSDGTPDCNDACPNDANKTAAGQCGCGNPDTDSDSDGTADCVDCGDGILVGAEQCDDGNLTNADGCSALCAIEAGYSCTGQPSVCASLATATPTPTSTPASTSTALPSPTVTPLPTSTPTATVPPPIVAAPGSQTGGSVVSDREFEINGVGTPRETVELSVDSVIVGSTQVSDEGTWKFSLPPLAVGVRSVTAVTIRSNGARSAPSAPIVLQVLESAALDFAGAGDTAVTAWRSFGNMVRYKVRRASQKQWEGLEIGGRYAVPGDYDGDGVSDFAAVEPREDKLFWNIRSSISGDTNSVELGARGDLILGGCKFQSTRGASLAVFRRGTRQLIVRDIGQTQAKVASLKSLGSADLLGCGDSDGDGIDEIIFKVRASDGSDAIAAFTSQGKRVVDKTLVEFLRGFVIRRSGTEVPLVALVLGTTRKGIPVRIETLAGSFSFPLLYVSPSSTIGMGFFTTSSGEQSAGLLWAENRTRTVFRRILKRDSGAERLFKLPRRYRLLRAQNIYRTR